MYKRQTRGTEPARFTTASDKTPRVGGQISVASFNVLNYFTTTGQQKKCKGGNYSTAVSYTHLDVYKRQPHSATPASAVRRGALAISFSAALLTTGLGAAPALAAPSTTSIAAIQGTGESTPLALSLIHI